MTLVKATLIPRQGPAVLQQAEGRAGQGLRAGDPPACGERRRGEQGEWGARVRGGFLHSEGLKICPCL